MLNRKTLYAIYLLHQARSLCAEAMCSAIETDRTLVLDHIRFEGYLSDASKIVSTLDETSLLKLLADLSELVAPLSLPGSIKKLFPRNMHQFNCSYYTWRKRMKSTYVE